MNLKLVFGLALICLLVVGSVSACGYGKYQRESPVVLQAPITAENYNVRHMSFIDVSVIDGMDEMEETYLKYKALEDMADMNKTT